MSHSVEIRYRPLLLVFHTITWQKYVFVFALVCHLNSCERITFTVRRSQIIIKVWSTKAEEGEEEEEMTNKIKSFHLIDTFDVLAMMTMMMMMSAEERKTSIELF